MPAVLGVAAVAALRWGPSLLLYHPVHDPASAARLSRRPDVEEVETTTSHGDRLHGWFVSGGGSRRPAVVYIGGNAEPGASSAEWLAGALGRELVGDQHVLVLDYPGYGTSGGAPSQTSLYAAGLAAYDLAAGRPDVTAVKLFGFSLGTGVATYVGAHRPAESIVLGAPFDDGPSLYNTLVRVYRGPLRALPRDTYPSTRWAERITAPTLLVSSPDDQLIPSARAERLLPHFPAGVAELVLVPGRDHNDLLLEPAARGAIARHLTR